MMKQKNKRCKALDSYKLVKLIGLNLGLAIINIIIFSEGLLNVKIGGDSTLQSALGVTALVMSFLIFAYGNYQILLKKEAKIQESEIDTMEECVQALKQCYVKTTFRYDIDMLLEQVQRFYKKKELILDILLQKFHIGEMSYKKFEGIVIGVEQLFHRNIRSIYNKINVFDEEDYDRTSKKMREENSNEFLSKKMEIYQEFIRFVKASMEDNEQILLKFDKLLLELSKFSSLEEGELENMSAMREIDELISKTKYYK